MNKFHFFRVLVCAFSLASVTLFVAPPAAQAQFINPGEQKAITSFNPAKYKSYGLCLREARKIKIDWNTPDTETPAAKCRTAQRRGVWGRGQ